MRRVRNKVTLAEARERLEAYRDEHGCGPFKASELATAIWPDAEWVRGQGAGAAASRVLKRLGFHWTSLGENWGWML